MTGAHTFNEVFFTDVRIPAENLVGDVNEGWSLAKVTLGNERVSLSSGGALWGLGPTARRPARPGRGRSGGDRRPGAAPARSPQLHIERRDPAPHPPAHGHRGASRASRPGPRRRCARCSPTSTASTIMGLAKDLAAPRRHARPTADPLGGRPRHLALRLPVRARRSPSAAAPATCSATSSPSGCSACPTTSTSRPVRPGPRPAVRDRLNRPPGRPRATSDAPGDHRMARKDDTPVFKRSTRRCVAADDLPGVAAGTPGQDPADQRAGVGPLPRAVRGPDRAWASLDADDRRRRRAGRGRPGSTSALAAASARPRRDSEHEPPDLAAPMADGRRSMKIGMQLPYAGGFKESAELGRPTTRRPASTSSGWPRPTASTPSELHGLPGRHAPRPSRSARASCRSTPARRRCIAQTAAGIDARHRRPVASSASAPRARR